MNSAADRVYLRGAGEADTQEPVQTTIDRTVATAVKRVVVKFIRFNAATVILALASALLVGGSAYADTSYGEPYIGRPGLYDYTPSMIQTGGSQDWWWCGQTDTDTILHQSYSPATGMSAVTTSIVRSASGWDSAYVCNPAVTRGLFLNPFGDSQQYTYAMYYVGTDQVSGTRNSIGAAFSNDGTTWRKYPTPVISAQNPSTTSYGTAEPAVVNLDEAQHLRLFYGDSTAPGGYKEFTVETTDGVHFGPQAGYSTPRTVTTNGLYGTNDIGNADFALDTATMTWYMAGASEPVRQGERELAAFTLYRIPDADLFDATKKWEQLTTVDTAMTGFELNSIPGLARDGNGYINTISQWPSVQMFHSVSTPRPAANATWPQSQQSAAVSQWDISWSAWNPSNRYRTLTRYYSSQYQDHLVTTGYVDHSAFDVTESTLGRLREAPSATVGDPGLYATVPLYSCKTGATDYFVSKDINCEGQYSMNLIGYASATASTGQPMIALYRCYSGTEHFVSTSSTCEGKTTEFLLGYAFQ